MSKIISMMNSVIKDIEKTELFNSWMIDMIPKLSTYSCIRAYISGSNLNKILKKSSFDPSYFYKIIIYIDDDTSNLNIIYFEDQKQTRETFDFLNLSSLLKVYTVLNDSFEADRHYDHSRL